MWFQNLFIAQELCAPGRREAVRTNKKLWTCKTFKVKGAQLGSPSHRERRLNSSHWLHLPLCYILSISAQLVQKAQLETKARVLWGEWFQGRRASPCRGYLEPALPQVVPHSNGQHRASPGSQLTLHLWCPSWVAGERRLFIHCSCLPVVKGCSPAK